MKIVKCDFCGEAVKDSINYAYIHVERGSNAMYGGGFNQKMYDCCGKCIDRQINILENNLFKGEG